MAQISVLLPFFNAGKALKTAIISILNQTFTDFELLLIDNNAWQEDKEIAEQYRQRDARIKIIKAGQQGIAAALNEGLRHVRTPFIARMDADDQAAPKRFEKQYHFLKTNPGIEVVTCQTRFSSTIAHHQGYRHFVQWQNQIIHPEDHWLYRFIESPLAHPTLMCHKSLFDQYGVYNTGPVPEDYELWLRWMEKGLRFYKIPEKLLSWHDHINRLSRTHNNYAEEAFYRIKTHYLARWLKSKNIEQVIICGTGKKVKWRAFMLQDQGITLKAFTDIKPKSIPEYPFLPVEQIKPHNNDFFVSFIAKRGVGQQIAAWFNKLGYTEGENFIRAA